MTKDTLHKIIYVSAGLIIGAALMSVFQGEVTAIGRGVFVLCGLALTVSAGIALVRSLR